MICICNLEHLNAESSPVLAWLARSTPAHLPGVSHDGINHVFPFVPEKALLAQSPHVIFHRLETDGEQENQVSMMRRLGRLLLKGDETLIVLGLNELSQLFNTAHYRLWCGNYDSWRELHTDYQVAFGEGVDGRKPLDELKSDARVRVKVWVDSA